MAAEEETRPKGNEMKYTTIASASAAGAYGFENTIALEQGTDGRCRIVTSGFVWSGNQGGMSYHRAGPFNASLSAELLAKVRDAQGGLDDDETLTYTELAQALGEF